MLHVLCCVGFMVVNGVRSISVWLNDYFILSLSSLSLPDTANVMMMVSVCVRWGGGTVCMYVFVYVCAGAGVMLDMCMLNIPGSAQSCSKKNSSLTFGITYWVCAHTLVNCNCR